MKRVLDLLFSSFNSYKGRNLSSVAGLLLPGGNSGKKAAMIPVYSRRTFSFKTCLSLGALLLVSGVLFTSCGDMKGAHQEVAVRYVKAEKITSLPREKEMSFSGKVKENREVKLSFRIGGPLAKLKVKEGDFVKKGAVIAQIDQRDYEIKLAAMKAQFQQAESEYQRHKELYNRNKLPANTFDRIEASYLMAKSNYEAVKNAMNDTRLLAPFTGYIHQKYVENFETVGAGQPIVSIIDMGTLEVLVNVPESQVHLFVRISSAKCDVKTARQMNIPLQLSSVSEKSNANNLFEARFSMNPELAPEVRPGMTAEVILSLANNEGSKLSVPVESVFDYNGVPSVWIYQSTTSSVKRQPVKVDVIRNGGKIGIVSGLKEGDWVVTAGVHSLVPDQKVNLLDQKLND